MGNRCPQILTADFRLLKQMQHKHLPLEPAAIAVVGSCLRMHQQHEKTHTLGQQVSSYC